ncbi:MAG TPA: ankyrin repeat domain-containing protein [Candidatus Polarisedimenticolia bacterium]|nr:ankyrin repeat domain-containing protein [Candidatus Polarisedimenticolia bacterium]
MSGPRELFEAVARGDTARVADLLEQSPDLVRASGAHGKTALHLAAEHDRLDEARLLLGAGADIEARTSWGASPLDWAAVMGSSRVAEELMSRGAGGSTLLTAAALGRLAEVRAIVESEQDLATHRRRGAPQEPDDHWPADSAHILGDVLSDALFAAGRNGQARVVEYLLGRGADIDAKGVFGGTALHWAAINGHEETVRLLLARGASRGVRDARFDSTPEGWAREGGHARIAAMLQDGREEG